MESVDYLNGDLNTSIIKTHVVLSWYNGTKTSPRPHTRLQFCSGNQGTLRAGYPTRVALEGGVEGITKDHHSWVEGEQLEKVFENSDHPLYKRLNQQSKDRTWRYGWYHDVPYCRVHKRDSLWIKMFTKGLFGVQ